MSSVRVRVLAVVVVVVLALITLTAAAGTLAVLYAGVRSSNAEDPREAGAEYSLVATWGEAPILRDIAGLAVGLDGTVYVAAVGDVYAVRDGGREIDRWTAYATDPDEFYSPRQISVDQDGDVYVVDDSLSSVRKFDPEGNLLAEIGEYGDREGQLDSPEGIAIDGRGNLIVTDWGNDRVQVFDRVGRFVASWGGIDDPGQFDAPAGVAVNAAGDIYVADWGAPRIQKFSAGGEFLLSFPLPEGDEAPAEIRDLAADSDGNIYATDSLEGRIYKFSGDGALLGIWQGSAVDRGGFANPDVIAIDQHDRLYVSDTRRPGILVLDREWRLLDRIIDEGASASAPMAIAALGGGDVLLADAVSGGIAAFDADGNLTDGFDAGAILADDLALGRGGLIYTVSEANDEVVILDADGEQVTTWGGFGSEPGHFIGPTAVATDGAGRVYVLDAGNDRVQVFSDDGELLDIWPDLSEYNDVEDVMVHGDRAFVIDAGEARVLVYSLTGELLDEITYQPDTEYGYWEPTSIASDAGGNLFVLDPYNLQVQMFAPDGDLQLLWDLPDELLDYYDLSGSITVAGEGTIFVALPETGQVLVYERAMP